MPLTRRELLRRSLVTSATLATPGLLHAAATPPADLILVNGRITTQVPGLAEPSALAIRDGLILATGSNSQMSALAGGDTPVVDLQGRRVIPGLVDSHSHITRGGRFYALELRWEGVDSLARGLEMVREQAARTPKGQWVRVIGGWSPYQFAERRLPTPAELSAAAPDTPVFVLFLYSQGYLNRAGVEALGITPENAADKAPPNTHYEFDESGGATLIADPNPNILYGTIGSLPQMSEDLLAQSSRHFFRELARFGLTSCIDAGGGGHQFPDNYGGTLTMVEDGTLLMRISNYLFPQKAGREREDFGRWIATNIVNANRAHALMEGFVVEGGGEFLVWSAGDFENFMSTRPDITQRLGWRQQLLDVTRDLLQAHWPLRIHATYDQSIQNILGVFEEAHALEQAEGRPGFDGIRWAVDHAETVTPESLARIRALRGGVAVQSRMAWAGEYFAERYGPEAAANAPPLRDILESGVVMGAGTDATRVSNYNPMTSLWWLISGHTAGMSESARRAPRHRLSRFEALHAYTLGSAWFSGEENMKGRLAPGQFADLAVLNGDLFGVPDDDIRHLESDLTLVAGRASHASGPFAEMAPSLAPVLPEWSPLNIFGGHQ